MASVTQRIKEIKQPDGGYLPPSSFDVKQLKDKKVLNENENITPSMVGLVVDYITRFLISNDLRSAFKISISGARIAKEKTGKDTVAEIEDYLSCIHSFNDKSIINACKAVTFDAWCRNPNGASLVDTDSINPDAETIANIKILINRSLDFWAKYGDYTLDGFQFGNGYTETVNYGDGDYLSKDTLWDFKVSKYEPTADHTLQLLMYYVMGQHSGMKEFKGIKRIGIFNPRLNKVYLYDVKKLPAETIKAIEEDVICYK
jgi:hypothetical protein